MATQGAIEAEEPPAPRRFHVAPLVGRWIRPVLKSPYFLAGVGYVALALVVFRNGGFGGPGNLPVGTNSLNAWLSAWYFGQRPSAMWLYPFTDWGQPVPGFTGPTAFSLLAEVIDPTQLVRGLEFVSLVGSGLSMMWAVRRLGGTPTAAAVAGVYYLTVAQTAQLFEGHVPAMISVALAPAFIVALWGFLESPRPDLGIAVAALLYLMVSVGDLGMLYFYLFFAAPMAAFAFGRRLWQRRYRLPEITAIAFSAALLLVLVFSWLYPFAEGARAQYTTNITTGVLPFSATTGENLVYAFSGYVQDNSFIHFTYHQMFYAAGGALLLPLFCILPLLIGAYALTSGRALRILLYLSAVVALVFSTGHLYAGLSVVNGWAYDHLPYFNAIPAVFRWVEYTILVYGIFLGWFLSALERRAPWSWAAAQQTLMRRIRRFLAFDRAREPTIAPAVTVSRARSRAGIAAVTVLIVGVLLLQNWALVAEPPGTFRYPAPYTAAFGYLEARPLSGTVLEIPFGGIYDRAPWGGVSASAALLTPAYTGADTAILEAGTVPSLALDEFIGQGLTDGGSRNMTKFLGSANVQYIVATKYSNWSYSSSSEYSPKLSYEALGNQTGLGARVNLSSAQAVYEPGNWAGNLSFHRSYLLYFGGDSILYSVLDSPWYPGPSTALVNGSTVGGSLAEFVAHAAGIVLTPAALAGLGQSFVNEAYADEIPLIEIIPPGAYTGSGVTLRADAWNATGGTDLQFVTANATATIDLATNELSTAGYTDLSLSGQIAAPPGAQAVLKFGGTVQSTNLSLSTVLATAPINVSGAGFFATSADNQTANYTSSVNVSSINGTTWVQWNPEVHFGSNQYLGLALHNISNWSGLALTAQSAPSVGSLAAVICAGKTCYSMAPLATPGPPGSNESVLRFLLPSGLVGLPPGLAPMLGNLTSLGLRWSGPVTASGLRFSNLSLVRVSTPGLVTKSLGLVLTTAGRFDVSLPPTARLGFLEISTGGLPTSGAYTRDLTDQDSATNWQFSNGATGWGILAMAQTYSPLWQISGPGPTYLATVDVGLTGWLVNDSTGDAWTITFAGDALEQTALVLEGGGLVGLLAVVVVAYVRPWRWRPRPRRPAAP